MKDETENLFSILHRLFHKTVLRRNRIGRPQAQNRPAATAHADQNLDFLCEKGPEPQVLQLP
jgi:hypothetical protein